MREHMRTPESPLRALPAQRRWRFHLWRGARAMEVGDLHGARRHFRAAYRQAPQEPLVCLAWGRELARSEEPEAGEALLRRAAELDPDLKAAVLERARVLGVQLHRRAEALELLDGLAEQPDLAATHPDVPATVELLRAELWLVEPADPQRARRHLGLALSLGADDATVRRHLARSYNAEGIACSLHGQHEQALGCLRRAAELDPSWAGPVVNWGAVLERLGQLEAAREQYRRALDLEPGNPVALENLAANLRKVGGSVEAERLYKRLGLLPAHPAAETEGSDVPKPSGEQPAPKRPGSER